MRTPSNSLPLLLLLLASTCHDAHALPRLTSRRWWRSLVRRDDTTADFFSPADGGGSMLTVVPGTFPAGLGEPLNAVLSARSHPDVLVDRQDQGGFRNWLLSINFAGECLGQHLGSDQGADLGDGNGIKNETAVMRYDYLDPYLGTCQETVHGGNHFRYWVQNGKAHDTGAIFMACSYEQPIAQGHDIIPNGYNLARDYLVGNATAQRIPTEQLQANQTFVGSTSVAGYTYQTTATYVAGLMANGSDGINHFQSVPVDGRGAVDGLVAVLVVNITGAPPGVNTKVNAASTREVPWAWALVALGLLLL